MKHRLADVWTSSVKLGFWRLKLGLVIVAPDVRVAE
eukprot:CAMPEP_0177662462 /NCGR_PEP_ID=MMETSP0447-20121125/19303_1 /TAXON_ID=0 /ORGANISM="Stygamoeba regulata, Strain BSH-02190019" /LENGTH=35 /DNA_ID= /DNA_START= /DNA_END= /DNA_ORIENTATION=